ESADLDEHERPRNHHDATWRHRSPAAVAAADAPGHPRGRPFDARHPNPSIVRLINPRPIMVTSPGPRLVADPVPPAIRPDPVPVSIRPPFHGNAGWTPTASI